MNDCKVCTAPPTTSNTNLEFVFFSGSSLTPVQADLTWNCQCNNGESPKDLAEYKDTIPFHICQTSFAKCIEANPDDALGQTDCKENIEEKCPSKDIANYTGSAETTTTESVAASTATEGATATTSVDASATEDAATSGAAAAASTTEAAGNGASAVKGSVVLVGAALAAFGYML